MFGFILDLEFDFFKILWTVVGHGLSFENSGLDLHRKYDSPLIFAAVIFATV